MDCFNCEKNGIAITSGWDWSDIKELVKVVLGKWGFTPQIHMAIEETAELQKALMKGYRKKQSPGVNIAILEEIADVQIMLWQLLELFDDHKYNGATYGNILNEKLDRLNNRVMEE